MGTKIKTYFTSDLHFGHKNNLFFNKERLENIGLTEEDVRNNPEDAINKHDEWLINLYNETVNRRDNVFILGDLSFHNTKKTANILSKLKGNKFLIRGNHDKSCKGLENFFIWTGDIKEAVFSHNQYEFIDSNENFCIEMCHFPLLSWNRRPHGTCHIHGHCHGSIDTFNESTQELRLDVGFDAKPSNGKLIELQELYNMFIRIKQQTNSNTFQEHIDKLMIKQGFRM